MLNRLKKNNKKGFTLVELIVVLVILAILAALLVPALTGYIDKAKRKAIVAETRQAVMAAQTLVDEAYGTKDVGAKVLIGTDVTTTQVETLAELGTGTVKSITLDTATGTKVETLVYETASGKCTYRPHPAAGETNSDGDYNVE